MPVAASLAARSGLLSASPTSGTPSTLSPAEFRLPETPVGAVLHLPAHFGDRRDRGMDREADQYPDGRPHRHDDVAHQLREESGGCRRVRHVFRNHGFDPNTIRPIGWPDAPSSVRLPTSGQRQGSRALPHRRRPPPLRGHRPHLGIRLRPRHRDPRQGPHPDRDERLLLRSGRRRPTISPGPPDDERIPAEVLGRALVVRQPRDGSRGVRGPRLSDRFGDHRLPRDGTGLRHRVARGADRGQQVRGAAVHPRVESRTGGARREHQLRRRRRTGRRRARRRNCGT